MPTDTMVYVVDDDEAMRQSLSFLLRAAKVGTQTFESAAAFLDALPQLKPGCLVTDVRMPGMSGLDLLRHLRERRVAMPVIVITGHGDVPLAVEAMKEGAADCLEKPFDDEALLAAIRSALKKQGDDRAQQATQAAVNARLDLLSTRERQVLEGLVAGQPNTIIAFNLGISPRTVEIYRAHVMTTREAASLSALVRMALVAGVLDRGPTAGPA